MAKLLLSCDDIMYYHDGGFYTEGRHLLEFYQRYLRVFDSLRLVTRGDFNNPPKQGFVRLDEDPRIECVPIQMFRGPKQYLSVYYSVGKELKNVTDGCDAAVLRIPSLTAMRVGERVMRSKIPYACEIVFDAEDCWRSSKGFNRLAWKYVDKKMREICAKADGISCVTEFYLQKHYFSRKEDAFKSHYSSLSIDSSFFSGSRCYPKEAPFIIAHSARWIKYNDRKGHIQLIDALKILKQRNVDVKVRFAGKNYAGGIERLEEYAEALGVRDMIEFVGFLDRKQIELFLNDANIYVLPTLSEGLPRVLIEAMAKGLPCITTPVSGNPELVDKHFLVDYYDSQTFANRIEELANDKSLYEKTSEINYKRSLLYENSILQERRDKFYTKLKERID